jgi:hypothetical protein
VSFRTIKRDTIAAEYGRTAGMIRALKARLARYDQADLFPSAKNTSAHRRDLCALRALEKKLNDLHADALANRVPVLTRANSTELLPDHSTAEELEEGKKF